MRLTAQARLACAGLTRRLRCGPFNLAALESARRPAGSWRLRLATVLTTFLWFCVSGPALANIAVVYTAQDLTNPTVGEDLWQYDYVVSGHDFLAGESLIVYFDFGAFEAIVPVSGPTPDWSLDAAEPDQFLGAGLFVATAPAAGATGPLAFSVQFHWLQPGRPMDQAFDLFGSAPGYALLDSGRTAPIPEPAVSLLTLIGLGILLIAARKSVRLTGRPTHVASMATARRPHASTSRPEPTPRLQR